MKKNPKIKVFLVDDDEVYLKSLEIEFLQHTGFDTEAYTTGEICVENLYKNPDIIVLDYLLDGVVKNAMNGLKTLDEIRAYNPGIPVIILSAQDKIEVAVNCMHHKAFDYIVKSETAFFRLQKVIDAIAYTHRIEKTLGWYMAKM